MAVYATTKSPLTPAQRTSSQRRVSFSALLFGATFAACSALSDAHAGERGWAKGRILVKMKAGTTTAKYDQVLQRHLAKRSGKKVHSGGADVITLPLGINEATAADLLSRDPAVEYAEVDRLLEPGAIATNDTYFANAWHLPKIGATDAWSYSTGAGVTIAICDSGVDGSHPDLAPLMVPGWNFYDNNSNTSDVFGHGTKVAGAAAASSNNGMGVASVSWQSKIMPLRVSLPDGTAYLSTVATAITWAADRGARVANVSFQSAAGSPTIQNAAQYMKGKGGMVVVSAGNTSGVQSFAASDALIAVSATDSGDNKASWSSYGAYVDLAAPGVSIWTTVRGGGYAAVHGTSFASPVTAGVIALMMARNASLTPAQIESILKSTAVDLGSSGRDDMFGNGRVNAAAAVSAAGGGSVQPPPPSGGGGTTTVKVATLSITFPSSATSTSGGQPSVTVGSTLTANWADISAPSSTDWIGLHVPGQSSTSFVDWMYVSCSKSPSVARGSGSCAFPLPSSMAAGTYELRIHTNNSYTVLAKSGSFGVTTATASPPPPTVTTPTLSVGSSSVARGGSLGVSWSGISAPSATDWIGLHLPGTASTAFIDWIYVNCSKTATSARASGSCAFQVPATVSPGTYQLRLHSNNSFTAIATSGSISVQ